MRLLSQADPEPAAEPGPLAEEPGAPPAGPEDTSFLAAEQEYQTLHRKTSEHHRHTIHHIRIHGHSDAEHEKGRRHLDHSTGFFNICHLR